MSQSATGTTVEFSAKQFKVNAGIYHSSKRMVDAASSFDSLDDAIAALKEAYGVLEAQAESGAGYTPDREWGFGSDNAAIIAESLLGRRSSVGATRKSFNQLGK